MNHSGSNNLYYQKGKTDLAVDRFEGLENPTMADLTS